MTLSYWLDSSNDFLAADLTEQTNFDIIIVGAGIAGLSTAYWLEKSDSKLKIAVVEKATLGFGASGRNAGFVTCGSAEHFSKLENQFDLKKAVEIWKFSERNRELIKTEIIQGDLSSVDFSITGSCTVAASEMDWQRYQIIHNKMLSAGLDVELIDKTYLADNYGVKDFIGAIQYNQDGEVHPLKLLKSIKSKLRSTKFIFNSVVTNINQKDESWIIQTNQKKLFANKVIFCLNGYTDSVLPELKEYVKPQRGQIIMTQPLQKFVKGPCYLTKHLCYFRQLPTGELLVGGFRNQDSEVENTNEDNVTPKIQSALKDFTHNYFRSASSAKINYQWSGVMGFTPDGQMIIGEHPNKKGIHIMAGCSGHGLGLSFHAALMLVENIFGQKVPSYLSIDRFQIPF